MHNGAFVSREVLASPARTFLFTLLRPPRLQVGSYGVGGHVKLPGPGANSPNIYEFGTPYKTILEDLRAKDSELYARNGLLQVAGRQGMR